MVEIMKYRPTWSMHASIKRNFFLYLRWLRCWIFFFQTNARSAMARGVELDRTECGRTSTFS
jgi:hypothetical protein